MVPSLGGSGGAVISSGGSSSSSSTPAAGTLIPTTSKKTPTSTTKKFYFNPQTNSYSTAKVQGQPAVTQQQAQQITTQTQQSAAQESIRDVAGFQDTSLSNQQLKLSPSKFQSGQSQFINKGESGISSFGSPTFISTGFSTSSIDTAPKPTNIFLTQPLVRGYVSAIQTPILQLRYKASKTKAGQDIQKGYDVIQDVPGRFSQLESAGVVDLKGTQKQTSSAFNDTSFGFDFAKGASTKIADVTRTFKDIKKEDVVLAGGIIGDTALFTLPTTRALSIGGGVIRGSKAISSLPRGLKGAAKLGTYIGEAEAYRSIALEGFDYGKSELGKQYTLGVGLLQAESFANIEGGSKFAKLIGSGKKVTSGKYMGTRLFPGFVEAGVGYNVAMDYAGGEVDVKAIGIPFTKKSIPIPEFRLGGGLLPGKTEKGTFKTGRILDTLLVGGTGSIMAASFAGLEYVARGSKTGKKVVSTIGYVADPAEAPGDVYTMAGGVSRRTTTKIPSFSFIDDETKTPSKTKIKPSKGTIPSTPSKTKSLGEALDKAGFKPVTDVPTRTKIKTKGTTGTGVDIPTKTKTNIPVPIKTKADIPVKTDIKIDVPIKTDVPLKADIGAFTDVTSTNMVFTPNFLIPPTLPSGGGGFGGRYKPKFRTSRSASYTPSVVGIVTGTRRVKGVMTGLGIRGVDITKPKRRTTKTAKKKKKKGRK